MRSSKIIGLVTVVAVLVACEKPAAPEQPVSPAKPAPKCLRERRVHIFGTYQAWIPSVGERSLNVDLTSVECLEWEVRP